MMKVMLYTLLFLATTMILDGCSGSPYRPLIESETLENPFVSLKAIDTTWEIDKEYRRGAKHVPHLYKYIRGTRYTIDTQTYPYNIQPDMVFFDKNSQYHQMLSDRDMNITDNDREQGIGYERLWVVYVQGMKCYESVFSRNRGGALASISNKNYLITCGYYDKLEGKRLLMIGYRYNYAGGEIRHQQDKDTPRSELLTRDQAELGLKQAVKKLVDSIEIKNIDRERMDREGLMHYGHQYGISPY